jgi:hypothetical protein
MQCHYSVSPLFARDFTCMQYCRASALQIGIEVKMGVRKHLKVSILPLSEMSDLAE